MQIADVSLQCRATLLRDPAFATGDVLGCISAWSVWLLPGCQGVHYAQQVQHSLCAGRRLCAVRDPHRTGVDFL